VLAVAGTALATMVYVVLWTRHGLRGGDVDMRVAVAGWLAPALVMATEMFLAAAGAAVLARRWRKA